jgi:hypothetical protein
MIRFKNKITVSQQRSGEWFIDTDRGDQYLMHQLNHRNNNTLLDDWWAMQHQSELRGWQMDLFLKELVRKGQGDDFVIWTVYKKGQGHNQAHDIMIFYHLGMKIWILSTQEYHWLMPGSLMATTFERDDSIHADICQLKDRLEIYPLLDLLNKHYETRIPAY